MIAGVLAAHPPIIAAIAVWRGEFMNTTLWLYLTAMVAALLLGVTLRSQVGRAAAVGFGLMAGASGPLHVGGGMTDLHIWFYALLALVALYQQWTPFLVAVAFVAVHHLGMSAWMPEMIFSTPAALAHPFLFAILHAVFLLAEAFFLAYGWKFTEEADRGRRAEQARAEEQAVAQLAAQAELAAERSRAAEEAAASLAAREERTAVLEHQISELVDAGQMLETNVTTATSVMTALRAAIDEISSAASHATTTANQASAGSRESAETVERLAGTMAEIDQIAGQHLHHRRPDEPAGPQRHDRVRARRRGGQGFRGGRRRGEGPRGETAKATERIRRVVETVREDVAAAGAALLHVQEVIEGVVEAQTTIAAAVEAARVVRPGSGGHRRGVAAGDPHGSGPAADRRPGLIDPRSPVTCVTVAR